MDNSNNRLQEVFFYGLYMDEEILESKGITIRNKRSGVAKGYKLRIGNMATLLRVEQSKAYGMIYSLTHNEIYKLYEGSGLMNYISEAILVTTNDNKIIATLCCNLIDPPSENEKNQEYYEKLTKCMEKYKLPSPRVV